MAELKVLKVKSENIVEFIANGDIKIVMEKDCGIEIGESFELKTPFAKYDGEYELKTLKYGFSGGLKQVLIIKKTKKEVEKK